VVMKVQETAQKPLGRRLFSSSLARTAYMIVNLGVAFYLLPFLVRHLGERWYGIWTILGTVMGYYYLVDFGLATAVSRYVTRYLAVRDQENANTVINTSLVIYGVMSLVILSLSLVAGVAAGLFLEDPAEIRTVRALLLVLGTNLALEFPFKAFAGVIGAYVRYDLLTYSHLLNLGLSTGLILFFLGRGHGIMALALIGLMCSQVSNVIFYLIAKHLFPGMRVRRRYFRKEKVRELFDYSIWAFLIQVSDQLRFKIDSVVIGLLLSAAMVTHYFVGARLVELFMVLVYRMTDIMTPVFTTCHARGSLEELRAKFLLLTKINAVLATAGVGVIIMLGRPFILRWMGSAFADSVPVLGLLALAVLFEIVSNPGKNVLYAIASHRFLAVVNCMEGVVNLLLSVFLISRHGILGVAVGTAVPLVITRGLLVPRYICGALGIPWRDYCRALLPTAAFAVLWPLCFYLGGGRFLLVPSYGSLITAAAVSGSLYLAGAAMVSFDKEERSMIWRTVRAIVQQ